MIRCGCPVNQNMPESITNDKHQMSKAASLAMELSKEKKRMQVEYDELQEQFELVSPSTPTGGPDSYLKWIGVLAAVIGIFLQNAGLVISGQLFYILGAVSWTAVGFYWNDKAVMLGSVIPATATAMTLIQNHIAILF